MLFSDEDKWLEDCFYELEENFRVIECEENLIDQFIMFGSGVPLQKGRFFQLFKDSEDGKFFKICRNNFGGIFIAQRTYEMGDDALL